MSTVVRVNFEPARSTLQLVPVDFPLADPTLSDPFNALTLVDGEWMQINSDYKILRAASVASAGNAATVKSWPLYAERGRSDVQTIAQRKMPIIYMGQWEFDTRIFDVAAVIGSGAAITTVGQDLKVASITLGSRVYCGLVGHGGSGDANPIVGSVTRLPVNNGGKLRMRGGNRY